MIESVPSDAPLPPPRLGDRSLFPHLAARAYLNHAALSPPSLAVERAAARVMANNAARGAATFLDGYAERAALRRSLATLLGAAADEIALVSNTTAGVVAIALSFPWRRGDRVLLLEGEFPTNVVPWRQAASLFDLEVEFCRARSFLDDEARALDLLDAALARGVRLVALSAVQFQTGLRMPLGRIARLCHARGAELFVDAIQALGAVPFDAARDEVDYVVSGAHKWLMGVEGAGLLYVRKGRELALRPYVAGWLSREDPADFLIKGPGLLDYDRPLRKSADVFESGTQSAMAVAGLRASVDLLLELGVARVFEHVDRYNDLLEKGLLDLGFTSLRSTRPEARSGILAVLPPAGVEATTLAPALAARGIACACPDGVLRLSPHFPNAPDEVPLVLEAVADLLGAAR